MQGKSSDLFGFVSSPFFAAACLGFIFILLPAWLFSSRAAVFDAVSVRADQFIEHYAEIGSDVSQAQAAAEMLCHSDYDIVVITVADVAYLASTSGEQAALYDNVAHLDVGSDKWADLLADAWLSNAAGMRLLPRDAEFQMGGEYVIVDGRAVSGDGSAFELWVRLRFDGSFTWERGDPQKWCVLHVEIAPLDETAPR